MPKKESVDNLNKNLEAIIMSEKSSEDTYKACLVAYIYTIFDDDYLSKFADRIIKDKNNNEGMQNQIYNFGSGIQLAYLFKLKTKELLYFFSMIEFGLFEGKLQTNQHSDFTRIDEIIFVKNFHDKIISLINKEKDKTINEIWSIEFILERDSDELIVVVINENQRITKITKLLRTLYKIYINRGITLSRNRSLYKQLTSNKESSVVKLGYTNLRNTFRISKENKVVIEGVVCRVTYNS